MPHNFNSAILLGVSPVELTSFLIVGGLLALLCLSAIAHRRSLERMRRKTTAELDHLLAEMHNHRIDGDFSSSVDFDLDTEIGQIAAEYNLVLDRVRSEISHRNEAESKWRGIFENAVEGIFQTSPEGNYLAVNPALARIYGYSTTSQLQESVSDIAGQLYVDPKRRQEFASLLEESDIITDFESQIRRRDGKVIWISENARAYRDKSGEVLYYEGTVEDITARKRSDRLIQDKEQAESACRAKSDFMAHMSQEIRTPLDGIVSMLDLLSTTQMDAQQLRYIEIARSAASDLLKIVNNVLDFSTIEAGKMELECIDFDFHRVFQSIPEMFIHQAIAKNIKLRANLGRQIPNYIHGDPERLRQVLINLTANAIKFTENGEVSLTAEIVTSENTSGPNYLRFQIRDTGTGITEEQRKKLFLSFTQDEPSTARLYGRTGLGLAICKQLVELMGGQIGVVSQQYVGSTFWFTVPLVNAEDTNEPLERTEATSSEKVIQFPSASDQCTEFTAVASRTLRQFQERVSEHHELLKFTLGRRDMVSLQVSAQALKSAAMEVEANDIARLALNVEQAAKANDYNQCGELISRMTQVIETCQNVIERLFDSPTNSVPVS
jgi:Amt family ammonium transporter